MKIGLGEVKHVAALARLELDEGEQEMFTGQLNEILGYFEKLQEVDTGGVEPTSHVVPVENVLRADGVAPSPDRGEMLGNAPDQEDGQFKVPRILD